MRQGAVGHVSLVGDPGHPLVEKRMSDPARHHAEVTALRALHGSGLPAPELIDERPGVIVMTHLSGERLDDLASEERREGLRASAALLRDLHRRAVPDGLPDAPDDVAIIERYGASDAPSLPLHLPPRTGTSFCHGDWADGNLLASDGRITGIVDWEAAHRGDPMRDLSRAAWHAGRKDPLSARALVDGYGADPEIVSAWAPIHAAELWLWFEQVGPPEYLERLTAELSDWA
nr:phosphotransferase [uncultured Microbacterium sp.]